MSRPSMADSDDDYPPLDRALEALGEDDRSVHASLEKAEIRARLFATLRARIELGRYELGKRLGSGGMGEVFAAFDPTLDRPVAIKLLHDDPERDTEESRGRMIREAKTLARLSHPNIVQVYEVGEANGRVFVAMELVRGTTLSHWQRETPRQWREVLHRYLEAGRGLQAVHDAGLVHRDFKPDNVLLGAEGRVCVADFGLARHATASASTHTTTIQDATVHSAVRTSPSDTGSDAPLTRTGRVAGTPAYMAPEQLEGKELDARADQFGFCVALYEGLYGRRPFRGRTLGALRIAHDEGPEPPPLRTGVPHRLWRVLRRGLVVSPDDRFESMDALLRALDPSRARRRRILAAAVVLGLPALAVGVTYRAAPDPCPRPSTTILGWDDEARERVRTAWGPANDEHGPGDGQKIVARLDTFADGVVDAMQRSCEATHVHQVQSEARLDRRSACIDAIGQRFGGLVTVLGHAKSTVIDDAFGAIEAMPSPELCSASVAQHGMDAPQTPALADAVATARAELAVARGWIDLDYTARADRQLQPLRETIPPLGYEPLHAELRFVEGLVAVRGGDPSAAAELMLDAAELAGGSRHDLLAAELWSELTELGYHELTAKQAAAWLRHARAAVRRIGSPPTLVTAIAIHEGKIAESRADYEQAREILAAALEERRAQGEPLRIAEACNALAAQHRWLGDLEAALHLLEEERRIYAEHLGPHSVRLANASYNVGARLVELGRYDDAREPLEAALEIWDQRPERHPDAVLALLALSQVELERGSLDRAQAHAQAALSSTRGSKGAETDHAQAELTFGAIALYRGDTDVAVRYTKAGWERLHRLHGDVDPNVAVARANLAEASYANGQHELALQHAHAALEVLEQTLPPAHFARGLPLKVLGRLALAQDDTSVAITHLKGALELVGGEGMSLPLEEAEIALDLSRAHHQAGHEPLALEAARAGERALLGSPGELGRRRLAEIQAWRATLEADDPAEAPMP